MPVKLGTIQKSAKHNWSCVIQKQTTVKQVPLNCYGVRLPIQEYPCSNRSLKQSTKHLTTFKMQCWTHRRTIITLFHYLWRCGLSLCKQDTVSLPLNFCSIYQLHFYAYSLSGKIKIPYSCLEGRITQNQTSALRIPSVIQGHCFYYKIVLFESFFS